MLNFKQRGEKWKQGKRNQGGFASIARKKKRVVELVNSISWLSAQPKGERNGHRGNGVKGGVNPPGPCKGKAGGKNCASSQGFSLDGTSR